MKSMLAKPDAAILLIQRALAAGIQADYVLMDTWFTTEPMLAKILGTGMDAIGVVKQLKQRYNYQGRAFIHCRNCADLYVLAAAKIFLVLLS